MKRQIEMPIHDNITATSRSLDPTKISNRHLKLQDIEEYIAHLKQKILEVKIRFDTNPNKYQREDYQKLIDLLGIELLHLTDLINKCLITIKINGEEIQDEKSVYDINIQGENNIIVENIDQGVQIKANIGEMNTPSTKIATINDIRNYIEKRLEWQVQ